VTLAGLGIELHKRNVAYLYKNLATEEISEEKQPA
jgi:hypothetical protein